MRVRMSVYDTMSTSLYEYNCDSRIRNLTIIHKPKTPKMQIVKTYKLQGACFQKWCSQTGGGIYVARKNHKALIFCSSHQTDMSPPTPPSSRLRMTSFNAEPLGKSKGHPPPAWNLFCNNNAVG